jgi:predicted Zn-dependent protease
MRRAMLALALASLALAGCQTVPYSGRHRLAPLYSEDTEKQMGLEAYQQVCAKSRPSRNTVYIDMVQRCGKRIAAVASRDLKDAERPDFAWEFKVIADKKTVNAFCLPGGKVAVYTGIMPLCGDETGLAVVLGHEIGHALARHGGERMSDQTWLALGGAVLAGAAGAGGAGAAGQDLVLKAWGAGTDVAIALPFSRGHESEADEIGLMLMAQAGYDPRQAPVFWKRMIAAAGSQPPEFLSTHPSHETRVADLEALMPRAIAYYNKATGQNLPGAAKAN